MAKTAKATKRAKLAKRTKRRSSKPPISVEQDCTVELEFTDTVTKEPETVRRLAHRLVEMLADTGQDDRVAQFVTDNLACLVEGFVIDKVTDLLDEARRARKAVRRG